MAEASINDLLPEVPYDSMKSDMKRQKLIEYILTRTASIIWVKLTLKNELTSLVLKKRISFSAITK